MKRYAKYKDSGIPWIGEIPEAWKVVRLFSVASEHFISNQKIHHQNLLSLSYGQIIRKNIDCKKGLLPESFDKYQVVEHGNIVLRFTDLQNDHRSLRVGLVKEDGIITSAYLCIAGRDNVVPEYLYLILHVNDIHKVFYGMGGGLRQSLDFSEFRKLPVLLPPLDEQRAIVEYLDSAVGRIDGYIAEKEAEIEKLGLLKQSVIAHAVTKGINPNVKMKDSGIPWIGEVPEHWLQLRGKNIFTRMTRVVEVDDEVITCFRDGQVTLRKNRRTDGFTESFKEIGYQGIRPGDLVIHQMDAFAGAIGVSDSKGKGTPVYICLQPKGEQSNFYYAYLLREMARTGYIKSLYRGIRERSSDFRYETFGKLLLPIPPADEQRAIVEFIDRKVKEIDGFISAVREQIEKLKLYKQRLISDVVTGKIKVCKDTLTEEVI